MGACVVLDSSVFRRMAEVYFSSECLLIWKNVYAVLVVKKKPYSCCENYHPWPMVHAVQPICEHYLEY